MKAVYPGFRPMRRDQLIQELVHDTYKSTKKPPEPTRCPECGLVYKDGRWSRGVEQGEAHLARCPACQRIHDRFPAGHVMLSGEFFASHRDEILQRVHRCEETETVDHPLERLIAIKDTADGVEVTTTGTHLARRLGDALHDAYKGDLEYHYNKEENLLRIGWNR